MKNELNKLVDDLAPLLAKGITSHIRSLVHAGEYKVALEELCAYVGEAECEIALSHWQRIEQLGTALRVDSNWWKTLPQRTRKTGQL